MIRVNKDNLSISVPSQDSGSFSFLVKGDPTITHSIFTVTRCDLPTIGDLPPIIEKIIQITDGRGFVELSYEDTDIRPGNYLWDMRFKAGDKDVHTPQIPLPAKFCVEEVCGNARKLFGN